MTGGDKDREGQEQNVEIRQGGRECLRSGMTCAGYWKKSRHFNALISTNKPNKPVRSRKLVNNPDSPAAPYRPMLSSASAPHRILEGRKQ